MRPSVFALFIDVMGVQRYFTSNDDLHAESTAFDQCQNQLEDFHRDLDYTIRQEMPLLLKSEGIPEPDFVAEFSDSAYIVGEQFASVAVPAVYLMRRAIRHYYPLRGGIGVGSFSHESSGARATRERQVWNTCSFLGGAVVTAYQAERSTTPGLRILIHPLVLRHEKEPFLDVYTLPLREEENSANSTHELRFWRADESEAAISRLREFRDAQNLSERPLSHYDAALDAYGRFGAIKKDLPHVTPAIWL